MESDKNEKGRKIKISCGFFGLFIVTAPFLFCNFSGQKEGSLLTEKSGLDMLGKRLGTGRSDGMKNTKAGAFAARLSREKWGLLLLLIAALLFVGARLWLGAGEAAEPLSGDYAEYERGVVVEILSDSTARDEASDGAWRGEQLMTVEVKTGQYAGKTLLVSNFVGPLYGVPLRAGDSAALIVNTYASGDVRATVYEYDRIPALAGLVLLFVLATVLVGGKTGLKSLVGLAITVLCLFRVLIPLLLRGAPTLPTVFLGCVYISAVSFTILGGLHRKTVCAMLGVGRVIALFGYIFPKRIGA